MARTTRAKRSTTPATALGEWRALFRAGGREGDRGCRLLLEPPSVLVLLLLLLLAFEGVPVPASSSPSWVLPVMTASALSSVSTTAAACKTGGCSSWFSFGWFLPCCPSTSSPCCGAGSCSSLVSSSNGVVVKVVSVALRVDGGGGEAASGEGGAALLLPRFFENMMATPKKAAGPAPLRPANLSSPCLPMCVDARRV